MSPDYLRSVYRRMLNERGETVVHRRYTGAGPNRPRFDVEVMAVVVGYDEKDFVGAIQQGDRKIILLAEDLIDAQVALPITSNDRIVVRGKELSIIAPDDSTRRVKGELIAYELQCRG
ncbi:MAG: hypothetical protein KF723_22160 [Rhizobiaceae bacterium]|nr:hypothetical protein [Rhizobiaceae bacterium]